MTRYLLAIAWTFALAAGFAGWGTLVGRALLGRREGDLGERIAWGLALTVAVGGVANLFHSLSSPALVGFIAVGLAIFVVDRLRTSGADSIFVGWALPTARGPRLEPVGGAHPTGPPDSEGDRAGVLIGLAIVVAMTLAGVRVAGSAHATVLSTLDDHSAYLAFPVQMLQTGGLTDDPFCDRRLETTLGGMSLLNAFALAVFAEESAKLVDLGVGFLAVVAGAVGLFRWRGVSGPALLIPVLLVELDRPPAANLSAVVIPVALLLAIHRALGRDERSLGRAALLGLLASALVSLKSTLFPVAFFVFAIDFLARIRTRSAWRALPVEVGVGLACLIPWMIALERSSGTYLYPLLGKGVHGTQYGTMLKPDAELSGLVLARNLLSGLTDPLCVAAFGTVGLALAGLVARRQEDAPRAEDLAYLIAPIPTALLMLRLFDEAQAIRYLYPMLIASTIVALSLLARRRRGMSHALIALAFLAGAGWSETRVMYRAAAVNIRAGLAGRPYVDPADRSAYAAMQRAIPAGEPVLTRLGQSFLMDFRRNPVYLADWPGGASPAPGMPSFRGPEALAAYLRGRGIRHVAYSYADQANLPAGPIDPKLPTWDRTVIEHALDFQANVEALMRSRHRAYDDGRLVVIDLAREAPAR